MSLIQNDRERVLAAPARKEPGSDVTILRKSLGYTADTYSISLTRKNIETLLHAAKIASTSDKSSGADKYFTDEFIGKALSGQR